MNEALFVTLSDWVDRYYRGRLTQAESGGSTAAERRSRGARSADANNFIAFAAHELRRPITVIRGYLDVLQDELEDVLEDDHKELFRRLTVSANRLTTYINNI